MKKNTPAASSLKSQKDNAKSPMTISLVAKEAGVSPSTVSRILNGTAVVSVDKKKAVDDAIVKLGFIPNPIARGLAGGRTYSVGVVTQAIDSPFYGASMRGIEDELDQVGYSPLFVSGHWKADTESNCLDVLRSRRVDGVIVLTGRLSDEALKNYSKHLPVVVTGRTVQSSNLYSLAFDNFEGGRLATQHLIDYGHKDIAIISGDLNHPDANDRLDGYRVALERSDITFNPELIIPGEYTELSGLHAVDKLLHKRVPFTAIFAVNDQMAFGAALGLHRHGLRVPEDVSLIGFDDLPASLYSIPPLSTVHQPAYELGLLAASSMLQLLNGAKPTQKVPAPRLIVRQSTRRLAAKISSSTS